MVHIKKFNEEYMYTFNYFCFGIKMSNNKEINNLLNEYDFEFRKRINGKRWEIDFPYHGGQVRGDVYSCVFGTIITDDDNNPNYLDDVRSAKKEDYIDEYHEFIKSVMDMFDEDMDSYEEDELEAVEKIKLYIATAEPCFYSVEASS